MATRSTIAQENEDGSVRMIYVHSDGHPEHMAYTLKAFYSGGQLRRLIDLGAIDCLGRTPETSKAFHRDNGDPKRIISVVDSVDNVFGELGVGIEWLYIRRKNDEWEVFDLSKGKEPMTLFEAQKKYTSWGRTMVEIWRAEGKIEALLICLREKFNKVSDKIESMIFQMINPVELDFWIAQAIAGQSIDEFANSVGIARYFNVTANTMKQITMTEALKNTSPHPVSLICVQTPSGATNLTPVSWWTYLENDPPMIGFSIWKESYSCELVAKNGKAVLSIPGEAIADITFKCGSVSGRNVDKVNEFGVDLVDAPVKFPVHSRLAFVCMLENKVDVGDCVFFICMIDDIFFNENERQLFAWNGSSKVASLP